MNDVNFGEAQREYYAHCQDIADEIEADVFNGDLSPEEANDRLWEMVDGSQWVIYTYRAKLVFTFLSDNANAYMNLGVDLACPETGDLNWSALAFAAMEADVSARIGDLDVIETEGKENRGE